jgi:hypothetical protein
MTWLERQVRAVSMRQLLLSLLAIAAFLTWCGVNWPYLENYFLGPTTMASGEIAKIGTLQAVEGKWIKATPEKIIDTGVDHITTTRRRRGGESKSVSAHYYAAQFGERLLFIKAESGDEPKGEVEGSFVPVPGDLFGAATGNKGSADLQARFLPVMLDTSDFRQYGNWGLIVGGLLSAGALVFGLRALGRRSSPAKHPALAALVSPHGAPSLAEASARIEHDLSQGTSVKSKGHLLTSGYHTQSGGLTMKAQPLSDLLWAFHRVTTNKIYGFIPVGRSHALVLHYAKEKQPIEMKISKANAEANMFFLATNAPWAVIGFDDGIAEMYKKQRKEFIAAIEDRKVKIAAAATQEPPTPPPLPHV